MDNHEQEERPATPADGEGQEQGDAAAEAERKRREIAEAFSRSIRATRRIAIERAMRSRRWR